MVIVEPVVVGVPSAGSVCDTVPGSTVGSSIMSTLTLNPSDFSWFVASCCATPRSVGITAMAGPAVVGAADEGAALVGAALVGAAPVVGATLATLGLGCGGGAVAPIREFKKMPSPATNHSTNPTTGT